MVLRTQREQRPDRKGGGVKKRGGKGNWQGGQGRRKLRRSDPLSSAPPLPSQKLLTHEGGGAGNGGDDRAG